MQKPERLTGAASDIWDVWAEELRLRGDFEENAQLLELACIAYASAVEASEYVRKVGPIIPTRRADKNGEMVVTGVKANPAVQQRNEAWAEVRRFCAELGLTPASRGKLMQPASQPDGDIVDCLVETLFL
jgi:P27 family predicted phage terminase small subunit